MAISINHKFWLWRFQLKAVYAQRDQSLSLRESESLQFEQLSMIRSRTEPSHQVNDQHRDKDSNHQQV